MTFVHGIELVLISLTQLEKLFVPVGVELLVLLDVGLFAFFALLLVGEGHLLHLSLEVLLLEFCDTVFGHFRLHVATFSLTLDAELFGIFDELSDIFGVDLLILAGVGGVFYLLGGIHIIY